MKKILIALLLISSFAGAQNLHVYPSQVDNINRMLQSNGSNVSWQYPLNWKYFAGVGDSSTDNSSAMQSFIDAQDSTPCVIYIGVGKFKFNSGVHTHSYSRISFIGAGGDGLNYLDATHAWNSSATRLIKDFTGNLIQDSAVRASNFTDIGFEDAHGNTTSGIGVNTLGLSPKYRNCAFTNFYICVEQSDANYPLFQDCHFINPVQYAIFNYGSVNPDQGDMTIDNCNFDGQINTTVAMIYQNSSGGTKITNCKWNGAGPQDCIYMNMTASTSDLFLANNSFENYSGYALHIDVASGVNFSNITVVGGNMSSYVGGSGMYLNASSNHFGIHRISIAGVSMNNLNRGIIAGYVDNMAIGVNNYDTTTISSLFEFTGCTHVYYDQQVATDNLNGLMGLNDRKYFDTLQGNGGITQFFHLFSSADTTVYYTFPGFVSDIAGETPQINTPSGTFVQMYSGGNTSIGTNGGYGQIHVDGGTSGYLIPTGLSDFDVSVQLAASDVGTSQVDLIARGTDINNFLCFYITSSDIGVFQDVSGTQTILQDFGTNILADGDIIHLQVSGSNWIALKNGTVLGSGTFDASLTTQKAGLNSISGSTNTHFTNFLITTIPDVSGGYAVTHDGSLTGDGVVTPLSVVGGGSGAYYQTMLSNGTPLTQQPNLNFGSEFALGTDGTATDVDLLSIPSGTTGTSQTAKDSSTKMATTLYVDRAVASGSSGTTLANNIYLPTITNAANTTSIVSDSAIWSRNGNTITVHGHVQLATVAGGSITSGVLISLPVNSNVVGGHSLFGLAVNDGVLGTQGVIFNSGTANTAALSFFSAAVSTGVIQFYYSFGYRVQ